MAAKRLGASAIMPGHHLCREAVGHVRGQPDKVRRLVGADQVELASTAA
jgi:hypothetical protein